MANLLATQKPKHPLLAVHYFALKNPDSTFLETEREKITFEMASERVKVLAGLLASQGISPGDAVATKLSPELEVFAYHAIYLLGAISCYVARQSAIPKDWDFQYVLTDSELDIHHELKVLRLDQIVSSSQPVLASNDWPNATLDLDETVRLVLTSGTTGLAKPAVFTGAHLADFETRMTPDHWGYEEAPDSTISVSLMGFGSLITFRQFVQNTNRGLVNRISDHDFDSVISSLPAECGAGIIGSPNQIEAFTESAAPAEFADRERVKYLMVVGAPPSKHAFARFGELFPEAKVVSLFGSTEVGGFAVGPLDLDQKPGFVGTILAGIQCQIVDDTGTELPDGQEGIIRVKREHMVTEYRYDVFETARAFMRGWFYPGDLGYKTADGQLFLTGRQTDLINLGGVKISPHPVEKLVAALEGIQEAVGFESKDADGRSHFTLAVVSEEKVDLKRLEALVKSYLPVNYPTRYIQLKELPRNENGKVQRAQIQASQTIQ